QLTVLVPADRGDRVPEPKGLCGASPADDDELICHGKAAPRGRAAWTPRHAARLSPQVIPRTSSTQTILGPRPAPTPRLGGPDPAARAVRPIRRGIRVGLACNPARSSYTTKVGAGPGTVARDRYWGTSSRREPAREAGVAQG